MTIAASLFSHVLDTYLEQRMQSPCTQTCKKKKVSVSNLTERIFYAYTRRPPALTEN